MDAMPLSDLHALEPRAGAAATLLRALANEKRLLILCELGARELTVGALQAQLGVSQSVLSQHLAVLRSQSVVATRRQSQTIFYRISHPAAAQIITTLVANFCPETHP